MSRSHRSIAYLASLVLLTGLTLQAQESTPTPATDNPPAAMSEQSSTPMTKSDLKEQRKQQKREEKASKSTAKLASANAKVAKAQAKAKTQQDKNLQDKEKANPNTAH